MPVDELTTKGAASAGPELVQSSATLGQPASNRTRTRPIFQPKAVQNEHGGLTQGLAGDRVQNNRATTHVVARGQRRILLVEPQCRRA